MEPTFILTDSPPDSAHDALLKAIRAYTAETVGPPDNQAFAILIPDPETGEATGGVWGNSRWGGLSIGMFVVPKALRGQGVGSRLMEMTIAEAYRRGCDHIWLDTYDFQARPFYERFGFEVFGQFDGPGPIYPRYFMRKLLSPGAGAPADRQ